MENEPTNNKINPILLAGIVLFAIIGVACLVIWIVQLLVNALIDDYTASLFSYGEAFALTVFIAIIGGLIGGVAGSRGK